MDSEEGRSEILKCFEMRMWSPRNRATDEEVLSRVDEDGTVIEPIRRRNKEGLIGYTTN